MKNIKTTATTENERTVTGMAEYIEREAAIRALTLHDCDSAGAKMAIGDLPAADVATVRHGRWEIVIGSNGKEYMVCTCCRVSQDLTGVFTYCPNCGAKMDGGAD